MENLYNNIVSTQKVQQTAFVSTGRSLKEGGVKEMVIDCILNNV